MHDKSLINAGSLLLKNLTQQQHHRLYLAVLLGVMASIAMIVQWYALARLTYAVLIQQQSLVEQSLMISLMVLALILRSVLVRAQEHYAHLASLHAREALRNQILFKW